MTRWNCLKPGKSKFTPSKLTPIAQVLLPLIPPFSAVRNLAASSSIWRWSCPKEPKTSIVSTRSNSEQDSLLCDLQRHLIHWARTLSFDSQQGNRIALESWPHCAVARNSVKHIWPAGKMEFCLFILTRHFSLTKWNLGPFAGYHRAFCPTERFNSFHISQDKR